MIGHLKLEHVSFSPGDQYNSCSVNNSVIRRLINFCEQARERGAAALISFPSISHARYNIDKQCNDNIAKILALELKPYVISESNQYVFDDALFFDTYYHLNSAGRDQRTDRLIHDLNSARSRGLL